MEYFSNRINNIKICCNKLNVNKNTPEGVVISEIIDVLDEMGQVLDSFLTENDEEDESYEYSFFCPECGGEIEIDEETAETEEEIDCPYCGARIPICATDF